MPFFMQFSCLVTCNKHYIFVNLLSLMLCWSWSKKYVNYIFLTKIRTIKKKNQLMFFLSIIIYNQINNKYLLIYLLIYGIFFFSIKLFYNIIFYLYFLSKIMTKNV